MEWSISSTESPIIVHITTHTVFKLTEQASLATIRKSRRHEQRDMRLFYMKDHEYDHKFD